MPRGNIKSLAAAREAKGRGYSLKTPIDRWNEDKTSLRKSVNAKCYDCCCGDIHEVRNCTVQGCPLWLIRPYQEKA